MDESTASEAGKLFEIVEQKLSEKQLQEVVSHEKRLIKKLAAELSCNMLSRLV